MDTFINTFEYPIKEMIMENVRLASNQKLLKAFEVAEILNISKSMAYRLIQQGQIPPIRIGRSVRVSMESLTTFIEQNTSSNPD
jgi:excisionase family DNA binding protein